MPIFVCTKQIDGNHFLAIGRFQVCLLNYYSFHSIRIFIGILSVEVLFLRDLLINVRLAQNCNPLKKSNCVVYKKLKTFRGENDILLLEKARLALGLGSGIKHYYGSTFGVKGPLISKTNVICKNFTPQNVCEQIKIKFQLDFYIYSTNELIMFGSDTHTTHHSINSRSKKN